MITKPIEDGLDAPSPVAWRYRYLYPGRANHWKVRQRPAYSSDATSSWVAVEAEPLYSAADVASLLAQARTAEVMAEALEKAREFAVLFLAFVGRDRDTSRIDRTLDDLTEWATSIDSETRALLATYRGRSA